jgi:endonuclease/exonuclease/phosphatase family metal-dependent hydrolase
MPMTAIELTPLSRRFAAHVCALVAAACLLLAGSFVRSMSVQAQTAPTLKVMDWNIHHGVDTSGANNLERVAASIVNVNPQVVSLNEVEKLNGYNNNADEPAVLESALESRTGSAWYACFAQRIGAATGQGNLVLSRIRIESCQTQLLSASRSVARAVLTVNNVIVTVFSTHLDDASSSTRTAQVTQLTTWAATAPEQRLLMGDFNASAGATELAQLRAGWDDAWAVAAAGGIAASYPGNTEGNTRNSRIDYIWRSKGAAALALQSAQVYDTGTISDHRPVSATYAVTTPLTLPNAPVLRVVVR